MFSILLAGAVAASSAQGVDVAELVRQARADHLVHRNDRFAPRTVSDAAAGKPFTVTLVPGNGDAIQGQLSNGAFYSYDEGKLELHLSSSTIHAPPSADVDRLFLNVLQFSTVNRSTGRQVGVNGFGARIAYDARSIQSSGIALTDTQGDMRLVWSATMDGPAAKRIALGSRFVVHGTVVKLPSGHIDGCASRYDAATVDAPIEQTALNCYVGGTVERVDLIGPSGLIKSWDLSTGSDGNALLNSAAATARPKGNPDNWITPDDYPLGESVSGTTQARLDVASDGHVSRCTVVASSGSVGLDTAACSLLPRRGRFTPAKDGTGESVPSSVVIPVKWAKPF